MTQTNDRHLRVSRTLGPGQPGSKKLAARFGERLVCVRHRLDTSGSTRYTTVELIVEQVTIKHRVRPQDPDRIVAIALPPHAPPALRRQAQLAGARWNPATRTWQMPYALAQALHLTDRIVQN